jgi:hypothetical protein
MTASSLNLILYTFVLASTAIAVDFHTARPVSRHYNGRPSLRATGAKFSDWKGSMEGEDFDSLRDALTDLDRLAILFLALILVEPISHHLPKAQSRVVCGHPSIPANPRSRSRECRMSFASQFSSRV